MPGLRRPDTILAYPFKPDVCLKSVGSDIVVQGHRRERGWSGGVYLRYMSGRGAGIRTT